MGSSGPGSRGVSVEQRYPLTFLLLRGFDDSDDTSENGMVGWVAKCADRIERGQSIAYYRHELGIPR